MTTNQTIDGVPRALLKKIEAYINDGLPLVVEELLLLSELRALLDAPAAQSQGDPVAWIDWSGGDCPVDADAMVEYAMAGNPQQVCRPDVACRLDWRHDHRPTKRRSNIVKYRAFVEQPAPVAELLIERLAQRFPNLENMYTAEVFSDWLRAELNPSL